MHSALLLSSLFLAATPLPWHLAAPDWEVDQGSETQAALYASHLNQSLLEQNFTVSTPGDLATALSADQRGLLLNCNNAPDCVARLGRAVGADSVLLGTMRQFPDGSVSVALRIVSSSDGRELTRTEASGGDARAMIRALDRAAMTLKVGLETATPPTTAMPPSASLSTPVQRRQAWVPAVTGALSATVGAELLVQGSSRFGEGARLRQTGPQLEENNVGARRADFEARRLRAQGFTGLGLGAAALAGAGLQYWLEARTPVTVTPFVGTAGNGIGFSGSF